MMKILLVLVTVVAMCYAKSHYSREFERMKALEKLGVDASITEKRMEHATRELKRQTGKKNVLWIVVDDFRPQMQHYLDAGLNSFKSPKMYTPNLDKLADRSLVLLKHYVQQSICSPSRTIAVTGRRPDTTRVYDLETYWRNVGGDFDTIPQYFKERGYRTLGCGKIFHGEDVSNNYDQEKSWTDEFHFPLEGYHYYKFGHTTPWKAIEDEDLAKQTFPDTETADKAIEWLDDIAKNPDTPFFMAVGFIKPHMPFAAPKRFFDYYPMEDIIVPENDIAPVDLPLPSISWDGVGAIEVAHYLPIEYQGEIVRQAFLGKPNQTLPDQLTKEMRRAYYASVSSTDYEMGRVLDRLEFHGLTDSTIVAFWGDHGFSLGEHSHWSKMSCRELANHAPLMFAVPGKTDKGIDTEELAETVDIFPTLVEAAGLPKLQNCPEDSSQVKACTEGSSLMPLIDEPSKPIKTAAFSQYPKWILDGAGIFLPRYMGYSIRTDRYRYTEYVEFDNPPEYKIHWERNFGIELYDYETDPMENRNVAADHPDLCQELSKQLRAGYMDKRLTD